MAMDHQVRAFREHITTSVRFEEAPRVIRFWDLIKQAMINLGEYAHCEGVEFRAKDESHNAQVSVGARDALRAVSNLLHNAIKYSWARGNLQELIEGELRKPQAETTTNPR